MVDIREIQIGNYFNVPNHQQCPFRVDSIEHFIIDLNTGHQSGKVASYPIINGKYDYNVRPLTWHTSDLKPIPLTEDILIRCGFEIKIKNTFKTAYELFEYPKIDVIFYPKEGYVFRFKGQEIVMIKHLHDLQNLLKLLCNQTIELK